MPNVSLYRLQSGHVIRDYVKRDAFEDALTLDRPERTLWRKRLQPDGGPKWAPIVKGGFPGEKFDDRPEREVAVIVVRLRVNGKNATWAATFGPGAWQSLRYIDKAAHHIAAAQLLYDTPSGTLRGLKKIVAGEIRQQAGTLTRQLTDASPLSAFDFDEYGQAFLSVSAESPEAALGRTMTAGNSVHLTAISDWDELLAAIKVLESAVQTGSTARIRLPGLVREADPPKAVRSSLCRMISGTGTGVSISLSDEERERRFRLSNLPSDKLGFEDYSIDNLRADLSDAGLRANLDYDSLLSLSLRDVNGGENTSLSVRLMATVNHLGDLWAIAEGDWWRMPAGWISRLDDTVRKIEVIDFIPFNPAACRDGSGNVQERLYNEQLVQTLPEAALLDKTIFKYEGIKSGIEIADVISVRPGLDGAPHTIDIIAVKRGLGRSSSQSHLFSQVRAAAAAIEDSATRSAFMTRIVNGYVHTEPVRRSILEVLEANPFEPSRVRFVLAISGAWKARRPVEAIPTLAKGKYRTANPAIAIRRLPGCNSAHRGRQHITARLRRVVIGVQHVMQYRSKIGRSRDLFLCLKTIGI